MMLFETLNYPMSLHSLTNNMLEEKAHCKNPPFGLNFVATSLHQPTNDKGLEFVKLKAQCTS